MTTTAARPGDTLAAIAARTFPGADVRRFTEILDANPDTLDVFGDLSLGSQITLPSTEQIEQRVQPALTKIASSLGGAKGFLGQAEDVINAVSGVLPSSLQGYAKDALSAVNIANGVIGEAETVLEDVQGAVGGARNYGGQGVSLVSWLLSGKS